MSENRKDTDVTVAGDASLFQPVTFGNIELKNRVVMAPMTRSRADDEGVPSALMATYYAQRTSAGLIITEGTQISQQGKGYPFTPGIHSEEQVAGWEKVTRAVHERGGRIFLQLAHVGRISHFEHQPGGALPVAPSALQPQGHAYTSTGPQPHPVPRALETGEIPDIVAQYAQAARLAERADFDGVEIHAGNGYLLDQFLRDGTNQRTDQYGGSIDNRIRLVQEVVAAVMEVWGRNRVGIRISPVSPFMGGIADSNPQALFEKLLSTLDGLLYVHVVEGAPQADPDRVTDFDYVALRNQFAGLYIANSGYNKERAEQSLTASKADLISFARPFIANPDLPLRLQHGVGLNQPDMSLAYVGGEKGYTDYRYSQEM